VSLLPWQTFPELTISGLQHGFTLRTGLPHEQLPSLLPSSLLHAGFPTARAITAEQPHGANVAHVVDKNAGQCMPGVDALITNIPQTPLLIRVADCGPVFIYDPVHRAIGLTHSGRKGTELNITGVTIQFMSKTFGSSPANLLVFLGPCIRPPHYEVDFAQTIIRQARETGAKQVVDSNLCTASDPNRYYSYRAEKGQTGRHWAALMLS
jgi:polyphenol oxidase